MIEATKSNKKAVVFTKPIEVIARRRTEDVNGERNDETVYVQLNRMDDLRSLRHQLVDRKAAASDNCPVGAIYEIANYPISDQLFLYIAERQKLAQIVDVPDDISADQD